MRTSQFLASAFSAAIILTLVAGCSGGNNTDGASTFAPSAAQTSGAGAASPGTRLAIGPLSKANPCMVVAGDVPLASAASFAVLGASTVTSTGSTILNGDIGVSPGTSITGFGPGVVNHGAIYAGGPVAAQAQADLAVGYNYTVALANPTALPADIGGTTIMPGLYNAPTTLGITGTVTLDGEHNSNSVFIFQIPSTLTTAVRSRVELIHDANACNIFWQVGSSATLNTNSHFRGTIMAAVSISVSSTAQVRGRLLAESGAVTMIDDRVNRYHIDNRPR